MAEECSHECSSCGVSGCGDRTAEAGPSTLAPNKRTNVKHVIGVVSGKGGVGKSLVTSLLASEMNKRGHKVAILDADITGPSIPKSFGVDSRLTADADGINPAKSASGIEVMSVNLMLPEGDMPVAWRGPVVTGAIKQFWQEVNWGDVDYMFVDMPPGTSDVFLTVFQSLPVDGIVTVSAPQELVAMIVGKAVNLAKSLEVPVVVARNMDLPRAGVTTRPTVDTPMGKGKCMVTAASAAPLSSSSTILRWPASSSATGTVVTPSPSSVPM